MISFLFFSLGSFFCGNWHTHSAMDRNGFLGFLFVLFKAIERAGSGLLLELCFSFLFFYWFFIFFSSLIEIVHEEQAVFYVSRLRAIDKQAWWLLHGFICCHFFYFMYGFSCVHSSIFFYFIQTMFFKFSCHWFTATTDEINLHTLNCIFRYTR